jgi:hypothetical protein
MKLLPLLLLASLAACSSTQEPPNSSMTVDKEVQPMGRSSVIAAIQECESSNTRAVVIYAKRKINGYTSEVVVDVSCAPKYK